MDATWRVGPEGEPQPARRCSCAESLVATDADGDVLCIHCGREPSIRLPVASESPVSASETSNGAAPVDPPRPRKNGRKGGPPMAEITISVPEECAEALEGLGFSKSLPELLRAAIVEAAERGRALASDFNGDAGVHAAELLAAGERIVVLSRVYGDVAGS